MRASTLDCSRLSLYLDNTGDASAKGKQACLCSRLSLYLSEMTKAKEIFRLIPAAQRRSALRALASTLLSAVVDLAGIAALISVLLSVLSDDFPFSLPAAERIYHALGFGSPRTFTMAVCGAALAVIVLKSIAGVALTQYRNRFTFKLYRSLASRMYRACLSAGLLYVRRHHTSRLVNNIGGVTYRFVTGIVWPALTIVSEGVLLAVLAIFLGLYDLRVLLLALIVFVPLAAVWIRTVRGRMAENGRRENRLQVMQNKLVFESLRGYTDITVNDARGYMGKQFDRGLEKLCDCRLGAEHVRLWSGRITEIALVAGVAAVIFFGTLAGRSAASLRLMLGIFAVASYRIVPAVSRIAGCLVELRRSMYVTDILSETLRETAGSGEPAEGGERRPVEFRESITLENVSFSYPDAGGRSGEPVLLDLSLTIKRGEKVGIRGASGAGKTTFVNLLCGFFAPESGRLLIDGRPVGGNELRSWQDKIALVSQDLFIPDIPLSENIAFGTEPSAIDRDRLAAAVRAARLEELAQSLPHGLNTVPGEAGCRLSGGQRQRIGIARAFYKRAEVLVLDEATSSLDELTESEIVEAIAGMSGGDRNITVIVVSHREATLAFCDRVIELKTVKSAPSAANG